MICEKICPRGSSRQSHRPGWAGSLGNSIHSNVPAKRSTKASRKSANAFGSSDADCGGRLVDSPPTGVGRSMPAEPSTGVAGSSGATGTIHLGPLRANRPRPPRCECDAAPGTSRPSRRSPPAPDRPAGSARGLRGAEDESRRAFGGRIRPRASSVKPPAALRDPQLPISGLRHPSSGIFGHRVSPRLLELQGRLVHPVDGDLPASASRPVRSDPRPGGSAAHIPAVAGPG